ncbi:MAG: hypothetical protein ACREVR_10770 [Burkholderiales bacterium]
MRQVDLAVVREQVALVLLPDAHEMLAQGFNQPCRKHGHPIPGPFPVPDGDLETRELDVLHAHPDRLQTATLAAPIHPFVPCERRVSFQRSGHRGLRFMSELDVAKEKIASLKVWLGILVITDISTFGWLIT